ncbi:MAG: protein kinase, partial [Planctomycetaceae bacterium]|nr:protein kinase [Planctomycetaceae bacterium]
MLEISCLSHEELRAWSLGQLDEDTSERIADHLAECTVCEETIASFDGSADSLLVNIRGSSLDESGTSDDSQAVVREALQQIPNPWENRGSDSAIVPNEHLRDYELLEALGTGGMGTVYRAIHRRLQRTVALKLLPARRLRDQNAIDRFEREMRAIGRLDHPAIVRATDAGEVDGTHFLAMDYVEGLDLSRAIRVLGSLSIPNACEIIRQAALGLHYAHCQGLIHRDVKPGNLMLSTSAESPDVAVRILDLGLALFGSASEAVDDLTTV